MMAIIISLNVIIIDQPYIVIFWNWHPSPTRQLRNLAVFTLKKLTKQNTNLLPKIIQLSFLCLDNFFLLFMTSLFLIIFFLCLVWSCPFALFSFKSHTVHSYRSSLAFLFFSSCPLPPYLAISYPHAPFPPPPHSPYFLFPHSPPFSSLHSRNYQHINDKDKRCPHVVLSEKGIYSIKAQNFNQYEFKMLSIMFHLWTGWCDTAYKSVIL